MSAEARKLFNPLQPPAAASAREPTVVVGAGPVGMRFVQQLLQRDPDHPVVLYGAERWLPYNRVHLTSVLAGESDLAALALPDIWRTAPSVDFRRGVAVTDISLDGRYVLDSKGRRQVYGKLVLALGSEAVKPELPGGELAGVMTLRNLRDVHYLRRLRRHGGRVLVVGGGPLGIEVAAAMRHADCRVTLMDRRGALMSRHLPMRLGQALQRELMGLGVRVRLGESLSRILGEDRVEAVELAGGEQLACDTVVFAIGIRPNTQLARYAGLATQQGIYVNDRMQSSNPDIYAIGECAEYAGQVHGLVAPGYEQADAAVAHLLGDEVVYRPRDPVISLKVVGRPVYCQGGKAAPGDQVLEYGNASDKQFRQLVLRNGRLVGFASIGEWKGLQVCRSRLTEGRGLSAWEQRVFRVTGELHLLQSTPTVDHWPDDALVCQCNRVSKAQICGAVAAGVCGVEALQKQTGAATGCGDCRPLLATLAQSASSPSTSAGRWPITLVTMSLLALGLALLWLAMPRIPASESVLTGVRWEVFWTDGGWKQITGFSLLALALAGLLMSLRKRIRGFRWGDYQALRIFHAVSGCAMLALLILHTGFSVGHHLNAWLMICVMGLAGLGALAGLGVSLDAKAASPGTRLLKRTVNWLHIVLAWPLPVLLGAHVFKVYYF